MIITVRATPGDVDRQIDRKARLAPAALRDALGELGQLGEARMHAFAPDGPTGNYSARITHTVEADQVKIGSKAPHAHLVERGRRPGKMPPPALMSAVFGIDRHAGFTLARSIGRAGTSGHHVLERARDALVDDVDRVSRRLLEDLGDLHR